MTRKSESTLVLVSIIVPVLALVGVVGPKVFKEYGRPTPKPFVGDVRDVRVGPIPLVAPAQPYTGVSFAGHVSRHVRVADVEFGRELSIPLFLEFTSEPNVESPLLGAGWRCPLFEAGVRPLSSTLMEVTLPTGSRIRLFKKKGKLDVFETVNPQWRAEVRGEIITVQRLDGWKLRFHNRRISELETDTGRVIRWGRNGQGMVEISEKGVVPVVRLVQVSSSEIQLEVNDIRYTLQKGPAVSNSSEIKPYTAGLRKISRRDGKLALFEFSRASDGSAMLNVTGDLEVVKPPWYIANMPESPEKDRYSVGYSFTNQYTWDAATRFIKSDKDWHYTVTPQNQSDNKYARPMISRKNIRNGLTEGVSYTVNSDIAIETRIGTNGNEYVRYRVVAPGLLYNKVQKIEERANGKTEVIFTADYNAKGRMTRAWDKKEGETLYTYNDQNRLTSCKVNGRSVLLAEYDTSGRMTSFFDGNSTNTFNFTYHGLGRATMAVKNSGGEETSVEVSEVQVEKMVPKGIL